MKKTFLSTLVLVICLFAQPSVSKELLIGLDADLSTVAKVGGIAIQRGAELAIDEINKDGGVLGHTLKLVPRDHRGNPARGIKNLKQFSKEESLVAVIGGVHTPVVLQELKTIHDNKLLFLVPWAAGTPITSNGYRPNYVFRVSIRDGEAGPVLIKHAAERGAKSVALILERTGWGRSNEKSMSQAAAKLGIQVTNVSWVNWGQQDVSKELAEIEATNPDAILLVANAPEGITISKALLYSDSLKSKPVISHWGIAGGSFVKGLGLAKLSSFDISTIQTFSFLNAYDTERSSHVLSAYQAKYDVTATKENIQGTVGLAQAYDLVHMLALAIKHANSTDRALIRDAFEALEEYKGLVKHYKKPFTQEQHDALLRDDYFIAKFNNKGNIVPK